MLVNWTDILDGAIANAAWGVVSMVKPRTSRNVAGALDTAAWADTGRLIRDTLAAIAVDSEMPDLPEEETAELAVVLKRHEVQGALQALLAVRLTDAPEADAVRARQAVLLALAGARGSQPTGFLSEQYAQRLSEYFDDKISALVGYLEGRVGLAGLAQVRAEAYSSRIVTLLGAIDRMGAFADSERGGQAASRTEVTGGQGIYAGNGGIQFNFFRESDTDRIEALLGAIERQVAALADPVRGSQAEADFLELYQRQAHRRHGFLTPPDFDRRRRLPVSEIYVPTEIKVEDYARPAESTPQTAPDPMNVWDLADLLDRTVLLGDPGGGKTTAANVLMDYFAGDAARRVPFMITLREYAAKTPIEWSVAEHIEQNLRTLYQSAAPEGLVERLLLTGRAVVAFDGLDELLDTSRRRDVSERVEQFCSAYPLTPVLVTSRVVGYEQARLDDMQFTCYRLGGFGDNEVAEYAGKWFKSQEGTSAAEAEATAEAFTTESAGAADLRANPLLLSLMCILYRGAGSLPSDRAGIYAKCAELLLRKWDGQRGLYRKLGADHLVEPTLRYLAWWLFTCEDGQTAVTERELRAKTAEFLYGRGYETEDEAQAAAREFIEFCRDRMWVFSDIGTTADGEKLYGFTHRTFLEYFTAWHLAVTADSAEDLARTLASCITFPAWAVVSELAVKIKSDMSDRGSDRIYAALLDAARAPADPDAASAASNRAPLLCFLATCLPSARPAPSTVRALTRAALDYATGRGSPASPSWEPLHALLNNGDSYKQLIANDMTSLVATLVSSDDTSDRFNALRLAVFAPFLTFHHQPRWDNNPFWDAWLREQAHIHMADISWAAQKDHGLRVLLLYAGIITSADVLAMPDGLTTLVAGTAWVEDGPDRRSLWGPYMFQVLDIWSSNSPNPGKPAAIGHYLIDHSSPPWAQRSSVADDLGIDAPHYYRLVDQIRLETLGKMESLGIAATACIGFEFLRQPGQNSYYPPHLPTEDSPMLYRYIVSRLTQGFHEIENLLAPGVCELEDLPIPNEFRQIFRDWAAGRVDFAEILDS